ncbi:MAG: hypothetical protein Q8O06_02145, partial [Acetobacterium sp.]|nr:hypothetical protein [Acetobacterium sp.]
MAAIRGCQLRSFRLCKNNKFFRQGSLTFYTVVKGKGFFAFLQKILHWILKFSHSGGKIMRQIAIYGKGGIGKSTTTQNLTAG